MHRLAALALMLAIVGFFVLRGTAAADPVIADQKIEAPSKLTVGDHLRYVIKLTAESGTTVTLAQGGLPEPFALTRPPAVSSNSAGGGRIDITVTLDIAAFAPGELDLPVKLSFKGPGSALGEVEAPPVKVSVTSVLPADSSALSPRDLKPQAEIGESGGASLLPFAAGAALLLALTVALVLWSRRRRRRSSESAVETEPEEAPPSAEDRARRVLDRAGVDFGADGDYVTYYTLIAGTLREYLTERFGFPAFALTTRELQDQMVQRGMDRWQARIVSGLLAQCDSVVYARYRPAAERADHDLTAAYEIIEMSRPGAEPQEPPSWERKAEPEEVAP